MPIDHRPFLELSPDMACVLDIEGRVLDLNDRWTALLKIPKDDLKGRSLADLVHPRDREAVLSRIQRLASGNDVNDAEHRFQHADKSYSWLSWSARPRPDDALLFASFRRIGDGTVSLRQLKMMIDGTTDFVGVSDLDGHVTFVNEAGMKLMGREGQDSDELMISDCRTPKGAEHSATVIRPAALRDGIWSGETELTGPGGKPIAVSQVFFLLPDEEGKPVAFGTIARDIRDQKARELELHRFKTIADSTSDLVAIGDATGKVEYLNRAGMRQLGREGEDPRSLRGRDLITEESNAKFNDEFWSALAAGGTWSGEPNFVHKDGHIIPTSCVAMMLPDHEGRPSGIALIARDLTSHRRVDALQSELRALSTPILEVGSGVLALPVIGSVDSGRASAMTEDLLNAIVRSRCRVAILDLTGVEVIDTSTLDHLFKMISAASLLGSLCVISGISAHVAQTVSTLGTDISTLRAFRTLEDALAFAQASARDEHGLREGRLPTNRRAR